VPNVSWNELRSQERFFRYVTTWSPTAIITGLTVGTLHQLRWQLAVDTSKFLTAKYKLYQNGTYFLWLREEAASLSAASGPSG